MKSPVRFSTLIILCKLPAFVQTMGQIQTTKQLGDLEYKHVHYYHYHNSDTMVIGKKHNSEKNKSNDNHDNHDSNNVICAIAVGHDVPAPL